MSYYRIYRYPFRELSCKHIYFKGIRPMHLLDDTKKERGGQSENKGDDAGRDGSNLIRARRTVRDLILCNRFDFFCTFTFNAEKVDRMNLKVCQKKITELFKNYKNRYAPDFRYLVIPEFHKDGAVHFHGMVSGIRLEDLLVPALIYKRNRKTGALQSVRNTKGYVDWPYYSKKLGFFSCSAVRNPEKCAWYVAKYITKDLADLPRGANMFMSSRNLARPELVFDADDVPPMSGESVYEDEFCQIFYQSESQTITDGYLTPWYNECCSDLGDSLEKTEFEEKGLWPRLTGTQLRFSRQSVDKL